MSYWILSESSLPEGPLNALSEALEQAHALSQEFCEPVMVYSGDGITNWDPVDVVFA
jgi:hypothetical protein